MTDPDPPPRPSQFKTQANGQGGLVRVRFVGEPHDGRELFIDELELPEEIYAAPASEPFEWWPGRLKDVMDKARLGAGATDLPVHYVLRIPDDTREPLYVSDVEVR